jgi:hypothetical protein
MGIHLASYLVHAMMKALLPILVLAACGREEIAVKQGQSADYNQTELRAAVDKFVAAGRTPEAYAELAQAVLALRQGMDRTVGQEAELKMVVLALGPVEAASMHPIAQQVEELAITVWPTLLAPTIEADAVMVKRDEKSAELMPKPGESPRQYLQRLCSGPLAGDCKQIVPEYQGAVVGALATRRATERIRSALTVCMTCSTEPGWHDAQRAWEALDRLASGSIHEIERRASPDNWPVAGNAAETTDSLADMTAIWREAEINAQGEVVIGGQHYGVGQRIDALRDLRGDSETITLHVPPDMSLAQVRGILSDVKRSGAVKVAVVARTPHYPWERRIYWLASDGHTRADLRPTDTLQLLLHTIDHIAGPGSVARAD